MGWSCSAVANDVLRKIIDKCIEQSGTQNVYKYNGQWIMWENSRKEHEDGSITGSLFKMSGEPRDERSTITRAGSFKIDGATGKVKGGYGFSQLVK